LLLTPACRAVIAIVHRAGQAEAPAPDRHFTVQSFQMISESRH